LDIWCMGYSPINLPILSKLLSVYPDREAADIYTMALDMVFV